MQIACGSSSHSTATPAECQNPKFDSLSRIGEYKMDQAEYAYFLQSALNCDKALALQQKESASESGVVSVLKVVGLILLLALVIVAGANSNGSGDPGSGDPVSGDGN